MGFDRRVLLGVGGEVAIVHRDTEVPAVGGPADVANSVADCVAGELANAELADHGATSTLGLDDSAALALRALSDGPHGLQPGRVHRLAVVPHQDSALYVVAGDVDVTGGCERVEAVGDQLFDGLVRR